MFTGLVEGLGSVRAIEPRGEGLRIAVRAAGLMPGMEPGDSVSVNGCCLTAVRLSPDGFEADVVPETVHRTTIGRLAPGDAVNLERSLRLDQRLGGHLVQGHVDGVGEVVSVRDEGDGRRVGFRVPAELGRFVAEKGAIAVDGVSLTVAGCSDDRFEVAYVPHTLEITLAGRYTPGTVVNVEVDLLARYVARWLESAPTARGAATATPTARDAATTPATPGASTPSPGGAT
jgi:riboflavin synthase